MRLNNYENTPEIFWKIQENFQEETEMEISSCTSIGSLESSWFFGPSFIQIQESSESEFPDSSDSEASDNDESEHVFPVYESISKCVDINQVENISSDSTLIVTQTEVNHFKIYIFTQAGAIVYFFDGRSPPRHKQFFFI